MNKNLHLGILIEYAMGVFIIAFLVLINKTPYGLYDWQTYAISTCSAVIVFLIGLIFSAIRRNKYKKNDEMMVENHLKELKRRILTIVFFIVMAFLALYFNANPLLERLLDIGNDVGYKLVYSSPQEILVQELRVAGITSVILSLPIITYEVAAFCLPAMEVKHAGIKVFLISMLGLFMFILGLIFADKLLLPFVYKTLFDIGITANIQAMVTVENYITFFVTFMICMGVIFEMPLLSILLSSFGILKAKTMLKVFKPAVVVIFIIAAIITPPDIVSQCMVAIPMIALYVISMVLCRIFQREKPDKRQNAVKNLAND